MPRRPLRLVSCAFGALLGQVLACGSGGPNNPGDASQAGASAASGGAAGSSNGGALAGSPNATSGSATGGGGDNNAAAAGSGIATAGTGSSAGGSSAGAGGAATNGGSPALGGAAGVGGSGGASAHAFKGVANSACEDLAPARLGASWWYNWTLSPGSCKASEFVPMIAGKAEKTPAAVASALSKLKSAGYRTVLGFNEPNKADQANLTVAQVIELWPSLTADPEVRVGSAATSADAKAWFEDFMAQVEAESLRVDFVAVHWYGWNAGSCDSAKELESYLTWAEKFKKPIWITEFGCMNQSNPSADVVKNFYAAAIEMFGKHSSVERYAWYPWNTNNELVLTGNLTALGTAFGQAAALR